MKKVLTAVAATGIAATTAMAGASATIDFANAHIFRGATVVDEFVIQPAVEFSGFGMPEEYGSFALGAWGSTAPFSDDLDAVNQPYETDWYLMYNLPEFVEGLDLYLGLTEYTYNSGLIFNESEFNLGAGYEVAGIYVGASFNYIYYNQTDTINPTKGQMYIPITLDYALELSEDFDVTVGGLASFLMAGDGNEAAGQDDGFNHYELYGAVSYDLSDIWSIGFSLAYIGQGDDKVLSDFAYDVSVLGMLSVGAEL